MDRAFLARNKMSITIFSSVIIFSLTILLGFILLSQTRFYIRDTGSSISSSGEAVNTISVTGAGKVTAKPDMASITVSISETKLSSKEAIEAVNKKVAEIVKEAKANGVKDEDIKTTSLSIYTEYDYSSRKKVLVGQNASQTLAITVKGISDDSKEVTSVIDSIVDIENISISQISFDIEDKTPFFTSARELAYKKAEQKASELAKLGNLELLEPVHITDTNIDASPIQFSTVNSYQESMVKDSANSTQISSGQLEISININVDFGIVAK